MQRMFLSHGTAFVVLSSLLAAAPSRAATPASGTLTDSARSLEYTFPISPTANTSGAAVTIYTCNTGPTDPCDVFTLTVDLPADFLTLHPNDFLRISAATPSGGSDIDLQLADQAGNNLDQTRDNPPDQPTIEYPAANGRTVYQIQVVPGSPHEGGDVTVTLVEGPPPPPPDADGDGIGDADDDCPGTPPGTSVGLDGCPLPLGDQASCTAPGQNLLTDAAGDNNATGPGPAGTDLLALSIFQPAQTPATGDRIEDQRIAFRLKVNAGATPNPANSWFTSFQSPSGIRGVRMTGDGNGNPVFHVYVPGANNAGVQDGRFVGAASPADASSSFNPAAGEITIVVKAIELGFSAPGQVLSAFNAGTTVTTDVGGTGNGGTAVHDGMPDNALARSNVSYALHDNTVCGRPRLKPISPPEPASGLAPRFYDHQSPEGVGDGAGEPTLGHNPLTNSMMFIAGLEVDRVTPANLSDLRDAASNPLPEACEPVWEDRSYAGAANTLDPILETEQGTGRTFQSQLSGANSIFAYTDDDGLNWIPGQAGPPNGGADHQTVGVGPWAPGAKPPTATEDYAVYYCSQSVAAAFCSRSDNGGASFGPGIEFRNTATDCNNTLGGLHGHVQVSRNDGTVHVPFGNCGDKVATAVSKDSGLTWTVKKVAPSAASDDPGLGIANDGTLYMCYTAGGGGRVFATVSEDDGDTWSTPYEIGLAAGVKHAVFTTAVAGDGDRAACAFLGTATSGNPEALDFKGVWYPYVATTYDRGETWHTVNVAPNDPVQGAGGICLSGTTCGSNRNLLDFNDIVMDTEGRVLFGYADGCKGACVQNPSQNTFSDNGVIARQSGGRTLLAAFDDKPATQFNAAGPIKPAAACASAERSRRTSFETRVAWLAPDDGASAIVNYKVYRSLAATGPFAFVGDSGPKRSFLDATADPAVEKYYYKVVAENALGAAPDSNVIELPLSVAEDESSCALPGITVINDSPADSSPPSDDMEIVSVAVAEPASVPGAFVITQKVKNFTGGQPPPNSFYPMLFPSGSRYIALDATQGLPKFTYGTFAGVAAGALTFTEQGLLDAASAYSADGRITFVVPRALLGNPSPGAVIAGFDTRTRLGGQSATSRDTAGPADYIVRGVGICAPNTAPVAVLDATPQSGGSPLMVTFDGRASFDRDTGVPDTIRTYSIDFGDGTSAAAEDGAPALWTHVYPTAGAYAAKLRVTDSRGMASDNAAIKVIEIDVPGTVRRDVADNTRLGGALSPALLVVLAGAALAGLGRRKRNH